jgi:hypothetical protein
VKVSKWKRRLNAGLEMVNPLEGDTRQSTRQSTDPLRELLREAQHYMAHESLCGVTLGRECDCQMVGTMSSIDAALAQPPDAKPYEPLLQWVRNVMRKMCMCEADEREVTECLDAIDAAIAAPQPPAGKGEEQLACGHPASLMLKSTETGEDLFCELCDCRSARNDAEAMEAKYKAERDTYQALLQEGADGFGRILIATGDDEAVYDWRKRVRAALKGKPIVADAIPREIHERLVRDARREALREAYEDLWNTEPADRMERLKQLASEHEGGK